MGSTRWKRCPDLCVVRIELGGRCEMVHRRKFHLLEHTQGNPTSSLTVHSNEGTKSGTYRELLHLGAAKGDRVMLVTDRAGAVLVLNLNYVF